MDKYNYFSENRIREIERKIERLLKDSTRKVKDPHYIYLDNSDLMRLLSIGASTAANWRKQKKISYSLVNQKLYYRLSDIEKMMEEHRQQ